MNSKIIRTIITVGIAVGVVLVLVISSQVDSSNPHSTIDKAVWLQEKHATAVRNARNVDKQCYQCHEEKGLGGQSYCLDCHEKSGLTISLPQ